MNGDQALSRCGFVPKTISIDHDESRLMRPAAWRGRNSNDDGDNDVRLRDGCGI